MAAQWSVAVVTFVGVGLLAYSAFRAYGLSFTHDESLTYLFHASRSYASLLADAETANNHLLNTALVKACASLFGSHPFWLRLPNLVAHGGYLAFSFLWLRGFERPAVLVAGFLVLNLNPYLLDFFSLARGYGLAMALVMACVYFMTRALRTGDPLAEAASWLTAAFAVLANYTLLNVYVALFVVFNAAAVGRRSGGLLRRNLVAVAVSSALLAVTFTPLKQLAGAGQLYYGATQGFWRGTVASLVDRMLYAAVGTPELARAIGISVAVLVVAASGVVVLQRARAHEREVLASPLFASLVLLLVPAASTIGQHYWLGTRFLEGRTALFFLPLFCVNAICLWAALRGDPAARVASSVAAFAALANVSHLLMSMNGSHVLDWKYDAGTVRVVDRLERERGATEHPTLLGINWHFGPTIQFYRETRGLRWLWFSENADTHHASLDYTGFGRRMDYYYVLDDDMASIEHEVSLEHRFPQTGIGTPALYGAPTGGR